MMNKIGEKVLSSFHLRISFSTALLNFENGDIMDYYDYGKRNEQTGAGGSPWFQYIEPVDENNR